MTTQHTPAVIESSEYDLNRMIERYSNKRDALQSARRHQADVYKVESENGPGWVYFVVARQ